MLNDLFILKKIKEGDIKAFENMFRCYYTPLRLYTMSIIGRSDVAEEIVQDIFYVLWRDRENLEIFVSVKGYLYKSARNRSLQYLEHCDVKHKYEDKVFSDNNTVIFASTPQEQLEYKELEELINYTLQKMPERRLQIFRMHRFEGLKYMEIAKSLSLSVKTIEAEMTKALQSLRKVIENYT